MIKLTQNQKEIIKKICQEIGIKIKDKKNIEDNEETEYVSLNVFQVLDETDFYDINFEEVLEKSFPFLSYICNYFDVYLPTQYPLGYIDEYKKDLAKKLKAMIYCHILSVYIGDILWPDTDTYVLYYPKSGITLNDYNMLV